MNGGEVFLIVMLALLMLEVVFFAGAFYGRLNTPSCVVKPTSCPLCECEFVRGGI